MNEYIEAQIVNMKIMVKTFQQSCKIGATNDDGNIGKEEAKAIKKIDAAAKSFIAKLEKIN